MVGLKKRSHTQKFHPKVVNLRDIAGERKKKKKKKKATKQQQQTNKQTKNNNIGLTTSVSCPVYTNVPLAWVSMGCASLL